MAKKPESRRQKRIRAALEAEFGGYWRKIWGGPFQQAGIHDILGCCEGLFFSFEVKEPNGTPSELQLDELEEILEAGGVAAIVIEPEDACRLVRNAIRAKGARRAEPTRRRTQRDSDVKRVRWVRNTKRSRHG